MYNGVAEQKNSLGDMLMVSILFLVWDHVESRPGFAKWLWSGMRWDRLALLVMAAWLLYLSESKTSLVCTLIGLALISARGWLASRAVSAIIFSSALSLPFLVLLTHEFGSIAGPFLEMLGRDATFTGRAGVWSGINFTAVNPLIGAGFYNFWGGAEAKAISEAVGVQVINAHSGYLDTFLDGGVIGLGILFILLITSAKRIIRNLPLGGFHRLRFVFLIVTVAGNLTESFFGRISPLWFTTVLVFINYPFRETNGAHRRIGL
jgi:O-antigen ligase